MRQLEVKNSRIQAYLNPVQRFWLDLWDELLHPATIDPHAIPSVNVHTLIDNLLAIENEDIKEELKVKAVKEATKELLCGTYGIRKDTLIKKEFKESILGEKPPKFDKAPLSTYFEYVKNLSKALAIPNNTYFDKLIFSIYRMISEEPYEENSQKKFEIAEQLENLLKSMLVELLQMGFSYKYLRSRLSIFLQKDHYYRGNIQHKIDSLFVNFASDPKKYTILFRLHDVLEFPKSQVIQGIELTSTVPEDIVSVFNEKSSKIKKIMNSFFQGTELNLVNEIVNKSYDILRSEKEFRKSSEDVLREVFEVYKNVNSMSFHGLAPLLTYFRSLSKQLETLYYSNPKKPCNSINGLWNRISKEWREIISNLDTEFALSSDEEIRNHCEALSKKKSINLLKSYLYRLCRFQDIKREIGTLEKAIDMVQHKNKIQFAIIRKVEAQDPFAAAKFGFDEVNRTLAYLRFQYGHLQGNIAKKCIVLGDPESRPVVMIVDIGEVLFQKHFVRKSIEKPEKLTQKINSIENDVDKSFFENVLRWYGLAMQEGDEISQFLALWVALESLVTKGTDSSEGPFIAEISSSILGLYFVRKTIRNLWWDFIRFSLDTQIAEIFNISLEEKKKDKVNEADFLYVLITQGQTLVNYLKNKQNTELLSYRVHKSCQLFSSPQTIRKAIVDYAGQVRWNLLRHYMLRNRIVHSGYRIPNIALYHTQLEYYFRIIFENIVHFCVFYPKDSIPKNILRFPAKFDLYLRGIENDGFPDLQEINYQFMDDEFARKFKLKLHQKVIDPVGRI